MRYRYPIPMIQRDHQNLTFEHDIKLNDSLQKSIF